MEYQEVVDELVKVNVVANADVFHYDSSPLAAEFDAYFQSSIQKLLKTECQFLIRPARFYFFNDPRINAKAGTKNNYNIIAVNYGLWGAMYHFPLSTSAVFNQQPFNRYNIDNFIGFSKEYLIFQISVQFCFYHEQTHLIQKSRLKFEFTEEYMAGQGQPYSEFKHVHEIDADLRASHLCAMHILGCWDNLSAQNRSVQNLENITVLGISGIFILFLHLAGVHPLYYRSSTHPHPLIRLTYVLDHIIKTIHENQTEINVNQKNILSETIQLVDAMYLSQGKQNVATYAQAILNNYQGIETFINEQLETCKQYPNLVMNSRLQN